MPIALPPIDRRSFLAGTLALGGGLLLPRFVAAGHDTRDPNRFMLLADTHVPGQRDLVHDAIRPAANLEQAVGEIVALHPRPAGAIVAGDCAFRRGEAADYVTLRDLLEPLRKAGVPVHLAMGNHDDRKHLLAAFPEARPSDTIAQQVPDRCISILEAPNANWFVLDSQERPGVTPGNLGQRQLAWLGKALDARPDKPALVVAHHNPDTQEPAQGLKDTKALLDVLRPRRQVKGYFFGHTHAWRLGQQAGIHMVNIPTLVWVFDKAQPRGYIDAHLKPDGVRLVLHALDHRHARQGQTVDLQWRK